jgi:hypothetical protein
VVLMGPQKVVLPCTGTRMVPMGPQRGVLPCRGTRVVPVGPQREVLPCRGTRMVPMGPQREVFSAFSTTDAVGNFLLISECEQIESQIQFLHHEHKLFVIFLFIVLDWNQVHYY